MLTRIGVKNVKEFSNAERAINHLKTLTDSPEQLPNLILCDLNMPGMDGFDFITHVRSDSSLFAKQAEPRAVACSGALKRLSPMAPYWILLCVFFSFLLLDYVNLILLSLPSNAADWMPETEQKCLECGFDGVLRKPVLLPELGSFLASLVTEEGTIRVH
jgi:CheY-like chemotaxis protein